MPTWTDYVVAQTSQAAHGLVPSFVRALGVRVDGFDITLVLEVPGGSLDRNDEGIIEIAKDLRQRLGPDAHATTEVHPTDSPRLHLHDGVRWFQPSAPDGSFGL